MLGKRFRDDQHTTPRPKRGECFMIGAWTGGETTIELMELRNCHRAVSYLVLLAVWGGICAFAATALRNFATNTTVRPRACCHWFSQATALRAKMP
jgi:hypothetical protein